MKKYFVFITAIMALTLALGNAMPVFAQEEASGDDPLVEGLPDDVPQPKKKATAKKAAKKQVKKKAAKKAVKKKAAKKKAIYVDEYKFKTNEFEGEPVAYKFNKAGNPIVSVKAGETKTRTFGKDYSQSWKQNQQQPSIRTKPKKNTKQYAKPNEFDDQSRNAQSDELTLPDGIGQPNGLIAVEPIIEQKDSRQ